MGTSRGPTVQDLPIYRNSIQSDLGSGFDDPAKSAVLPVLGHEEFENPFGKCRQTMTDGMYAVDNGVRLPGGGLSPQRR
jgi:hypothetical protein